MGDFDLVLSALKEIAGFMRLTTKSLDEVTGLLREFSERLSKLEKTVDELAHPFSLDDFPVPMMHVKTLRDLEDPEPPEVDG